MWGPPPAACHVPTSSLSPTTYPLPLFRLEWSGSGTLFSISKRIDMPTSLIVVGAQWGDEGTGKVVDALAEHFDIVVRYQGGANAGHTVIVDGTKFILQLLPTGILRADKTAVIGQGVVVDPEA